MNVKMDDDTADVLEYTAGAWTGPKDVRINGEPLKGVQSITATHTGGDYAEVVLVLKGTQVVVSPPVE